jgi:ferredoxin-thioredoxin reductase catalytic subunit
MPNQPSEKSLKRMRTYVQKYWEKTGTSPHPEKEVTEAVILGLARISMKWGDRCAPVILP